MESYNYQANINELLNIVVNNIYSNKDIFLRELISNSNDAIKKYKYYNKDFCDSDFFIKIIPDMQNKILRIYDNGIGMNKEDIINNIGKIAHSDTKDFAKKLKDYNNLIGHFGIGFYSSFLVSKKVSIITKKEDVFYKWESVSNDNYTIDEIYKYDNVISDFTRGTVIECHLKDDCYDYLNKNKLKEIIVKHNQFIIYPIYLHIQDNSDYIIEHINNYKSILNSYHNTLSNNDCIDFYKYYFHSGKNKDSIDNPLIYKILYGEGKINYKGIIYIPNENIVNMFEKTKQNNIKLYVKNVLITENSKEICPEWLSFLAGIIETDDIPLNISRENLQQNDKVLLLKKQFIKKTIDFLKDLMIEDFELYKQIYSRYGKFIKFGIRDEDDMDNIDKLKDLLIFNSLQSDKDNLITLKEYIETLKDGQNIIYYIINENYENIITSPYIEKFKNKEYNVLFMTEPVDEYLMETFKEYNGFKFICIGKGVLYLNDTKEELEKYNKKSEEYNELCEYIKNHYNGQLLTVKISLYLTKTPCIIYAAEYGISANMEKILKAQTMITHTNETKDMMHYKNLELNPFHSLVIKLKNIFDNKEDCIDLIDMLFTTALLHAGYNICDNKKYIENIYKLLDNDI